MINNDDRINMFFNFILLKFEKTVEKHKKSENANC